MLTQQCGRAVLLLLGTPGDFTHTSPQPVKCHRAAATAVMLYLSICLIWQRSPGPVWDQD